MDNKITYLKKPILFRLINKLGENTSFRQKITSEHVLNTAKNKTGFNDYGPDSFINNLDVLIESTQNESRMNFIGRTTLFNSCVQAVVDRLKIYDHIKKHPDIKNNKIVKPIFILGLPRTGTTLMQNLLGCDKNLRALHYWEQAQISDPPKPNTLLNNQILNRVKRDVQILKWAVPNFTAAHEINPIGIEECNGLMNREFVNILHFMFRNVPTYVEHILNTDMSSMYQFHKLQLPYLGYHFRGKRWMLKAPAHLAFLSYLFKIYPDAIIIQMHRDPIYSVPSMCSLATISRSLFSTKIDVTKISDQWINLMQKIIRDSIQKRTNLNQKQFLDIPYMQFVNNPIKMVKKIYDKLELDFSDNFVKNMQLWLDESNKKRKNNPHIYSINQFGLTKNKIKKQFSEYYEHYAEFI